jgi:hypothetical protein
MSTVPRIIFTSPKPYPIVLTHRRPFFRMSATNRRWIHAHSTDRQNPS